MENSFAQIFFRDTHHISLLIALAAGLVGAFLVYRSTDPQTSVLQRVSMAVLRFFAIAGILFMLADPILLAHHKKEITPSVAVLLDDTQSMKISDKTGDRAQKLLSIIKSPGYKKLDEKYPTHKFVFSDSLRELKKLKFDGNSTALGEALSELLDTASSLDLAAVIVASDGQNNIGIDPLSVAASYPVPIYTIGIGDPKPSPDVAITQVLANPVTYENEKLPLIAYVQAWRIAGKRTTISVWEGKKKLSEHQIELPRSGQVVPVKFEITPTEKGIHYYTVRVPKVGGEISKTNNAQSVAVKVLPSRKRVLIACDHPSWEVSAWRRAIESDPHIETELFINKGGGDAKFTHFPADTASLNFFDAIVLIYGSQLLTAITAKSLEQYVKNGGSFLWIMDGGEISAQAQKNIEPALPVNFTSSTEFIAEQFVPSVAADGFSHPIMQITRQGEELSNAIAGMPPLYGFVATTPKPDAAILLVHPEKDFPVLAVIEHSAGRSAVVCGAPFWRWSIIPAAFGGDDHIFTNLAQNIIKFLLAKEKITRFALRPGKRVYRSGEPVTISASLRDVSNQPQSGAKITAEVKSQSRDSTQTFSIELTDAGNGIYEAQLPSLSPGKYKIFGVAQYDGKKIGTAKSSVVVEEYQLEFAQSNQDKAMLEGIADVSGGKYFPADSSVALSNVIKIPNKMRTWTTERELWSEWWLLVIIVFALATEWILRKRANLL